MEGTFLHFGGVPAEILFDNARALVEHHDAVTREVRFNARLHAFARYWGFTPKAWAPYRARTKGKDERGVGYVKRNAIAGRRFPNWGALVVHLDQWNREVADERVHGTTGELPIVRFADEAGALRPLGGRAPFGQATYRGRLCPFSQCPKGKQECLVLGCGRDPFLQQHAGFTFWPDALAPDRIMHLYDRRRGILRRAAETPAEGQDDHVAAG